jgi:hypothetical protein
VVGTAGGAVEPTVARTRVVTERVVVFVWLVARDRKVVVDRHPTVVVLLERRSAIVVELWSPGRVVVEADGRLE